MDAFDSPRALAKKQFFDIVETLRKQYYYIFPTALPLPIQQKRLAVLQSRLRLLVGVMAIGLPSWSVLEFFVFPHELWLPLFQARMLAGAALAGFLLWGDKVSPKSIGKLWRAYLLLGVVFVVPMLLYVFCVRFPAPAFHASPFAVAIANGYSLLPFAILACIGFFPLTVLESACIVTPFLTGYCLTAPISNAVLWLPDVGMMWVMALLSIISVIICYSQLHMFVELVSYSSYDLLTNCLGRRTGEEVVKTLWHSSIRKKSNLAVAFVDLDHFKEVNDEFGHLAGDAVLANTATAIKETLRESDFVIRWGGEEFLVVLPDANLDNASSAMKRVAEKGSVLRPDGSPQTVSIGVSERLSEAVADEKKLIQVADERLYQAKTSGRSRIMGAKMVIVTPSSAPVSEGQ